VRYRVAVEDGRLWLTTGSGWRTALDAVGADRFLLGPWTLRFVRDADGTVGGLELHRARLWNLRFEKEKPPLAGGG
jgi:hypothetical protein